MDDYKYQIHKEINVLEEVVDNLKNIGRVEIQEDKDILKKGWQSHNGEMISNICEKHQKELLDIVSSMEDIINRIKNSR